MKINLKLNCKKRAFLKGLLPVFCLFGMGIVSNAQPKDLSGKVTDAFGEVLIGVSVSVQGATSGAVTDVSGIYTVSAGKGDILVFSYLGMKTQRVTVGTSDLINIVMEENATLLNETVVIGYGTQKAKDLTAPIAMIKGDDLAKQSAANPMSALQGKVAGVQVINSGAPGAGSSVKIRGVGSIGDYANPLYVVDGAFVDNIDFLSSSDIETMNVLKDASASAIYGVRAANGVILITTKKGSAGRTDIGYDGYVGLQVPVNIMKLANKNQYIELLNSANANTSGYVPKDPAAYPASTDWYKELVRTALMHNHALNISGASDKTNYSAGVNYFYQEGIMKSKNDYERLNFRLRLDQNVNDRLKIGGSTVVSNYGQYSPNNEAVFSSAFVNPPVYPLYDDTNTDAYPEKFGSPQNYGFSNSYGNPYATAYYNNNKENGLKLIFAAYAEVSFIPEKLTFKTSYNLSYNDRKSQTYIPEYYVGGSQGERQSHLNKTFVINSKQIVDNVLTYNGSADSHRFSLMLGESSRVEQESQMTGSAVDVPGYDESSMYLSNGSFKNRFVNDEALRHHGLSFFTRETYNYKDTYLATFTFRADGSSKYNEHWGYFPSLGLGWILTNEDFMQKQKMLEYLKLRASWGLLGNDNIPANSSYILGTSGAASSGIFGDKLVDGPYIKTGCNGKWSMN